jgi:hypothetical protein
MHLWNNREQLVEGSGTKVEIIHLHTESPLEDAGIGKVTVYINSATRYGVASHSRAFYIL